MIGISQAIKLLVLAISIALVPNALAAKGGKGGNAGSGNGGDDEPQYSANGHLGINAISTNLSFANIIFRGTPVDLEEFVVSDPDKNGTCPGFDLTTGTLVLGPRDDAIPGSATFKFGFQGDLSNNGKTVQYFLEMDGTMTPDVWPPTGTTTLSFNNWSIYAENKKSRQSDCEGADSFAAGNEVQVDVSPYNP
jgi:hypothetical protein